MLLRYRSHRGPALAAAAPPVLEFNRLRNHGNPAMSHLALVAAATPNRASETHSLAAHNLAAYDLVAHDLRNLLATIGLHLETLARLAGPSGAKAADAAQALLGRGAALCNCALERAANTDIRARRRGVDPAQIARQIADLLGPAAPKSFGFRIDQEGTACVLADPDEMFRILFNLISNAVGVAQRKPGALTTVTVRIRTEGANVTTHISDDGPGLPAPVRARLFAPAVRGSQSSKDRHTHRHTHGYGLAIARELTERNGGTLTLDTAAKGAAFALTLPALLAVLPQDRSLGRRAAS
jgi:two-component system, sensor histidine kinase and response regulator